jgi:hypothetical protein
MNLFRAIVIFFIFSSPALASDTTAVKQKRFAIGITVSPEMCSRSLTTSKAISANNAILAYSAGANVRWRINKQLIASVGLEYSQKGWMGEGYDYEWGDITNIYDVRHQYNYLGMPVRADLSVGEKRMRFLLSSGITPAYLLYERRVKIYQYGTHVKTPFNYIYNPFNLFLSFGVGTEIKLGRRSNLQILPQITYGLLKTIYYSYSGAEHLYSGGLRLSWNFMP